MFDGQSLTTKNREQRTENKEQRTKNKEQRTENREQRTENREQRTERLGDLLICQFENGVRRTKFDARSLKLKVLN